MSVFTSKNETSSPTFAKLSTINDSFDKNGPGGVMVNLGDCGSQNPYEIYQGSETSAAFATTKARGAAVKRVTRTRSLRARVPLRGMVTEEEQTSLASSSILGPGPILRTCYAIYAGSETSTGRVQPLSNLPAEATTLISKQVETNLFSIDRIAQYEGVA